MAKIDIDKIMGDIAEKFSNTDYVDGMQNAPDSRITTNFQQEYTVIIRKKKYFAITASKGNEEYIRVYQVNNFSSINTGISTTGAGSCSVTIVGDSKIICAEKQDQKDHGWGSFDSLLSSWSYGIDDNKTKMDDSGNYTFNKTLFDNEDDMKRTKYGWKFAEKCDFEPMDEIYIYGKSRREKDGDKYKMYQIFFGYIDDVKKSYTSGSNPLISINATDHTKLLKLSYIANTPAVNYQTALAGIHYDKDIAGNLIIDDNPLSGKNGELAASMFTNVFAGQYPYEIIQQCAEHAGIPDKYLQKRIEKVKRIPYLPMHKDQVVELFQSDLTDRLTFCQEAADKTFLEFYADEEGNLVLKIPNYTLGINKLLANSAYIGKELTSGEQRAIENAGVQERTTKKEVITYETVTETITEAKTHKVVKHDTLWDLAQKYLGDATRWNEIYQLNKSKIKDPHWIYPGQVFTIKVGKTVTKQVEKKVYETVKETVDGGALSSITDKYIPVVRDDEVISFVLSDSDSQIINAVQIKQETALVDVSKNGGEMATIRAVQDWPSIIRFGMRIGKTTSTPLLDNEVGPAMFGSLMIQRSLAQRYTGSLTMIEDSSIRVGNPIRVSLYDDHPFKFICSQAHYGRVQAVFYVNKIERSIKPNGVSIMTLSLCAGRVIGMNSLYDDMYPLYKKYYEEYDLNVGGKIDSLYEQFEDKEEEKDDSSSGGSGGSGGGDYGPSTSGTQNIGLQMVNFAKQFIGVPYVWGGTTPSGFDCSGLVQYVYKHFGINLPRVTFDQVKVGRTVSYNNMQPGDLIFINWSGTPGHVGMYVGNGNYIHAPQPGDRVKIATVSYIRSDINSIKRHI